MRVEKKVMTKHIPVLLEEVKKGLHLTNGMTVVDATLGGGGHTRMMLEAVAPGKVIAFDTDREAIDRMKERASSDSFFGEALRTGHLVLVSGNYSSLKSTLTELGIDTVDAILADLGFSSDQIEAGVRGFSFQEDGPLDMRLDQSQGMTVAELVKNRSVSELTHILREYGDEEEAKRIALAIERVRTEAPINTTRELADLIISVYPKSKRRTMKTHPATKTFQAFRIAVNQEFVHLERFLEEAVASLSQGGRLAVITFHSGEDKRVKQFLKRGAESCICPPNFPVCCCGEVARVRLITKKPIRASEKETTGNPRARSAKLRIAEKIE